VYVSGSPLASVALALPRTIASLNVSVGLTVIGFVRAAGVTLAAGEMAEPLDATRDETAGDESVFPAFVAFAGAEWLLRIAVAVPAPALIDPAAEPGALADAILWLLLPVEEVLVPMCVASALATADPLASAAPTPRLTAPAPSQLNACL
jgi:hypothetical protein